jgi:putative RecB family exonuclease
VTDAPPSLDSTPSATAEEKVRRPLSPSRAKDYLQCPKLFWYKTIEGRRTLPTVATTRGNLAHTALEHLFDHEPSDRTSPVAISYVEPAWRVMTSPLVDRSSVDPDSPEARIRDAQHRWVDLVEPESETAATLERSAAEYRALAPAGSAAEAELVATASTAVANYFVIATPAKVEPIGREMHVEATIGEVPLHGFIDRLDRHVASDGTETLSIIDYKTGKPPRARYVEDAFFAMWIYALVLTEQLGTRPDKLRLLYLSTTKREEAVIVRDVTDAKLATTETKVRRLYADILQSAEHDVWETKKQRLCDWCDFQAECPAWAPS